MDIFEQGKDTFFRLRNSDGKEWLIPKRNMWTALLLYQPSGWKGKLLKSLLPWITLCKGLEPRLFSRQHICLRKSLHQLLCQVFGAKDIEFAVFFGTPCAHQKITIQVFQGEKILGYCKLTDKEEVYRLFKHEQQLLTQLAECGVEGTPVALGCGQTDEGLCYFAQSTVKTRHSTYPHQWGELHERFIRNLYEKTRATMAYEDTDYHEKIQVLKSRMEWFTPAQQRIIGEAVGNVERVLGQDDREWSAYHADFTPWNMMVEQGRLFVFDWEYALRFCPPMLDRCHFLIQTRFFEQHQKIGDIVKEIVRNDDNSNFFDYLCYLIITIAIYVEREDNAEAAASEKSIDRWIRLTELLMKEKEEKAKSQTEKTKE